MARARRLIRRRQRGTEVAELDLRQYGWLVSRVALGRSAGGQCILSRALGEVPPALEALEAKKMQRGDDFGALVRERRLRRVGARATTSARWCASDAKSPGCPCR